MKELLEKRLNLILVALISVVAIGFGIPLAGRGCSTSTSTGEIETQPPTVVADATPDEAKVTEPSTGMQIIENTISVKHKKAKNTSDSAASKVSEPTEATEKEKTEKTATKATTPAVKKVYATVPKTKTPASHEEQWSQGYIIAIDSPDTDYSCGHIELSDKNRDLLERLCMGEFGSGGFVGASLIAQAVKNAMFFDGFTDVQDVIDNYHYTGSVDIKPTKSVKEAVIYIFDMDKDAVQHRVLYMYNPEQIEGKFSAYHESRRYICTYEDVRFFDR